MIAIKKPKHKKKPNNNNKKKPKHQKTPQKFLGDLPKAGENSQCQSQHYAFALHVGHSLVLALPHCAFSLPLEGRALNKVVGLIDSPFFFIHKS